MVDIVPLTTQEWKSELYRPLLPPHASCRFHPAEVAFLAYAALDQGEPAGLLVARPIIRGYELEHLFILPSHRGQGLARQLLDLLVATMVKQEELILTVYLSSDNPYLKNLEHLMTGPGWFAPQPFIEQHHHDVHTLTPPWFDRIPPLPKGFEEFPWAELTEEQAASITHQGQQGAISLSVLPTHRDKNRIEWSNSIGLRHEGEVIGWMVTHRVADEVIRYSALYIDPRFRHKGLSIRLVVNAIKKQQLSPCRLGYYEIMVKDTLPSWRRFVQRRVLPYVQKVNQVRLAWKKIQPN